MISIGFSDMRRPLGVMDVFRPAMLQRSVGGAMLQNTHAVSDVIHPKSSRCFVELRALAE
jgi:hypothetical protein